MGLPFLPPAVPYCSGSGHAVKIKGCGTGRAVRPWIVVKLSVPYSVPVLPLPLESAKEVLPAGSSSFQLAIRPSARTSVASPTSNAADNKNTDGTVHPISTSAKRRPTGRRRPRPAGPPSRAPARRRGCRRRRPTLWS